MDYHIATIDQAKNLFDDMVKAVNEGRRIKVKTTDNSRRTISQNDSIHLYCEWLAKALNDAGIDMRVFFKPEFTVPWSMPTVKENLWRAVQKAMYQKESTTQLTRFECCQVYDVINQKIASQHGIYVPFPDKNLKEAV